MLSNRRRYFGARGKSHTSLLADAIPKRSKIGNHCPDKKRGKELYGKNQLPKPKWTTTIRNSKQTCQKTMQFPMDFCL
jgi:hypothetical protein